MAMSVAEQTKFDEMSLQSADHFDLLLKAMAKPGTISNVPASSKSVGVLNAGAVMALTSLTDHETPVWICPSLASETVNDFLRFHCSCPLVDDPKLAMFAVLPSNFAFAESDQFNLGTLAYPDASTTLIIQAEAVSNTATLELTGPGIKSSQGFEAAGLDNSFWNWRRKANQNFPLGTDVFFATDEALAALPRTTNVREIA